MYNRDLVAQPNDGLQTKPEGKTLPMVYPKIDTDIAVLFAYFSAGSRTEDQTRMLKLGYAEACQGFPPDIASYVLKKMRFENPSGRFLPTPQEIREACIDARRRRHQLGLSDPEQDALEAAQRAAAQAKREKEAADMAAAKAESECLAEESRQRRSEKLRNWHATGGENGGEWEDDTAKSLQALGMKSPAPHLRGSHIERKDCIEAGIPIPRRLMTPAELEADWKPMTPEEVAAMKAELEK